jgi:hypothetical protein
MHLKSVPILAALSLISLPVFAQQWGYATLISGKIQMLDTNSDAGARPQFWAFC